MDETNVWTTVTSYPGHIFMWYIQYQ